MKRIFLLIIILLAALISIAQIDSSDSRKSDSLYYRKPFFEIYPRIMNSGEKLKKKEAAAMFNKIPAASDFYKKYRNNYKAGLYSFAGVFVFTAIGSISFDSGNRALAGSGLVLSLSSFISSIIFFSAGESKLKKAIHVYNQHALRY